MTNYESVRSVKDVGLDPMEEAPKNHSDWSSEFKRLQREIIELWEACNVPLAHRAYFFLLFKGDPTDSIYMEVERRRLSFLKDSFSQGKAVQDGQTLTPASRYDVNVFYISIHFFLFLFSQGILKLHHPTSSYGTVSKK